LQDSCSGDGYGRNGIWLAAQGFRVSTVDVSPVGGRARPQIAASSWAHDVHRRGRLATWNGRGRFLTLSLPSFWHLPPRSSSANSYADVNRPETRRIADHRSLHSRAATALLRWTEASRTALHCGNPAKGFLQRPKCWNLLEWKSFWTKAAYTEGRAPWSKASFGNSEARSSY